MINIFSYLLFFFHSQFLPNGIYNARAKQRQNNEFQLSVIDRLILRISTHTKRQPITVEGLVIVQKEKKKKSPILPEIKIEMQ